MAFPSIIPDLCGKLAWGQESFPESEHVHTISDH